MNRSAVVVIEDTSVATQVPIGVMDLCRLRVIKDLVVELVSAFIPVIPRAPVIALNLGFVEYVVPVPDRDGFEANGEPPNPYPARSWLGRDWNS